MSVRVWAGLIVLAAAPAAARDWRVWRHDPERTGRQDAAGIPGAPGVVQETDVGSRIEASDLVAADLDLDGLPEAVFAASGRLFAVRPGGAALWTSDAIGAIRPLGVADLDGDARPEIVATTDRPGLVRLDGADGRVLWTSPAAWKAPASVFPIDLGDGGPPALYVAEDGCAHDGDGLGRLLRFAGGRVVESVLRTETHDYWCGRGQAAADVDGDGRLEIIAPADDRVWAYDPAVGFSVAVSPALGTFPIGLTTVAAADLDGDGDDELILSSDNPYYWIETARRVVVLEHEDGVLRRSWQAIVNAASGRHRFLAAPAGDVVASSPGSEVVTSVRGSGPSDWRVRVYAGLPEGTGAEMLAELVGYTAIALADVDDDGVDEVIAREADALDPGGMGVLSAWRFGASEPEPGWVSERGIVPVAAPSWGAAARPFFLPGPLGFPALLAFLDPDGDGIAVDVALLGGLDGSPGAAYPASGAFPPTAAVPVSGGGAGPVVAFADGRVALFDAALALRNDLDRDGRPDLRAGRFEPRPVAEAAGGRVAAADGAGRVMVAGATGTAERSLERAAPGARVALAGCDCADGALAVAPGTDADGASVLLGVPTAGGTTTATPLGGSPTVAFDPLPIGATDRPAHPAADSVLLGTVDEWGWSSRLVLVGTGRGAVLWGGAEERGGFDGIPSAADLDGDGTREVLAVRRGFLQVLAVDATEIRRGAIGGGGLVTAVDIDADGRPELFRSGSSESGPERIDPETLARVWRAAGGVSHAGRCAAAVPGPAGAWSIVAVPASGDRVVAYAAADGTESWRAVPAGGRIFSSREDAAAAGMSPGTLSSPSAAGGTPGSAPGAILVGSSDGRLYALDAATGDLAWSAPLGAAVLEPIVAGAPGSVFIAAPTADGRIHRIVEAALPEPGWVIDWDGEREPTSPGDEMDRTGDASRGAALWAEVSGAAGYRVTLEIESGGTVVPWTDVGTATRWVDRGLTLVPGTRYRSRVRAYADAGVSRDAVSDGFVVADDADPDVSLAADGPRILPDADGVEDETFLRVTAADAAGLRRIRVAVLDATGREVIELARREIGGLRRVLAVPWNGRGPDGRVVAGGTYRAAAEAEDSAGRWAVAEARVLVCAGETARTAACAPGGSDAGDDAGDDVGTDAGPEGGWLVPGGGGGCACRAPGGEGGGGGTAGWAAAIAAVLAIRRRRR
jgi:outer membrane protein assembly factor BamB